MAFADFTRLVFDDDDTINMNLAAIPIEVTKTKLLKTLQNMAVQQKIKTQHSQLIKHIKVRMKALIGILMKHHDERQGVCSYEDFKDTIE
jgi:hypothetical protein